MKKNKIKEPTQDIMPGPLAHHPFAGIRELLNTPPVTDAREGHTGLPPGKDLRRHRQLKSPVKPPGQSTGTETETQPEEEEDLFLAAMEDVAPLARTRERDVRGKNHPTIPSAPPPVDENREVLEQLTRLVTTGEGFILSLTPEYIEGTGYNIHSEYARRLHAGDFSIQAHLDLHGLSVVAAKEVFDAFMHEAIMTGKTGVLIIHGRGLSSPAEPVLKKKVIEWLTTGSWRKRIFAYASARSCDGGTGATYVLFRPRVRGK